MSNRYMYLFIREDLSIPQQIIQTAHATDELSKRIEPTESTNFMVLFAAKCEEELIKIAEWLKSHSIDFELFFEPDIQAYTSIATEPLVGSKRELFKGFKLKR